MDEKIQLDRTIRTDEEHEAAKRLLEGFLEGANDLTEDEIDEVVEAMDRYRPFPPLPPEPPRRKHTL